MNARVIFVLVLSLLIISCTSVKVIPINQSLNIELVCIQENPDVKVQDFVSVMVDGFERHGIPCEVFSESAPEYCKYILIYEAKQTWDITYYLSHAELTLVNISKSYEKVGHALYHLKAGGGLSLNKWQDTKTKMDPVIDELLVNF